MCILNHLGRMEEYFEFTDLPNSSVQFYGIVPKLYRYIDGLDPRLFFVDKKLKRQEEFDYGFYTSYIELIGSIFSRYAKTYWRGDYNPMKELADVLDNLIRVDPGRLDKSIVCTPDQFEDIRKEYLEKGKVNLDEILKKDYSIKYKLDSIWV
jgi:hypothetical protein